MFSLCNFYLFIYYLFGQNILTFRLNNNCGFEYFCLYFAPQIALNLKNIFKFNLVESIIMHQLKADLLDFKDKTVYEEDTF